MKEGLRPKRKHALLAFEALRRAEGLPRRGACMLRY